MNLNPTAIKLFIGVLLFITWVVLVVLKVVGSEDLITAIKLALAGLGAYHLNDRTNMPNNAPSAPTDKQAGFASTWLLSLIALGLMLVLSGCAGVAGQSPQSAQASYVQACDAYGAAFAGALVARQAGKLNQSQIDQVTLLDAQITPICTGPLPTDPALKTQQIVAAVTTMAVIGIIQKEVSK
jgi:hypothetical protein